MDDSAQKIWVTVNGERFLVEVGDLNQRPITVVVEGTKFEIDLDHQVDESGESTIQPRISSQSLPAGTVCEVTSPMPGDIVQILVKNGQKINPGDPLCVLDAMKMKNTIHAQQSGTIIDISVKQGDSVEFGTVLLKYS
ncbi:MAG: biotin/lipoyl-binding protein [Anaerolineales bacterium]|nr:biotin/lipoyl-binding protein [Anaerolineales bacterium]